MLDYTLFKKVTSVQNGKRKGLLKSEHPQYEDEMKSLVREFNNFTRKLVDKLNDENIDSLKIKAIDVKNSWQNSGYYNPYFWNKIIKINEDYDGIAIWILINADGLRITLGTTGTLENKNNKSLIDEINNKFYTKCDSDFDGFERNQDDKYTSYLYKKEEINIVDFIKALKQLVPIYEEVLSDFRNKREGDTSHTNSQENVTKDNLDDKKSTMNNNIKNIILYGSPGVGKTHNTKKLISLIESGLSEKEIFERIQKNDLNSGVDISGIKERVKFVTFHQSFGYEDFIEGFRPNETGDIELEKGIFLDICKFAEENLLKSGEKKEVPFSDAFKTIFKDKIENEESVTVSLKRAGSFFKVNDYNDKTIYFEKQSGTTKHTLSIASLEKMYNDEKNDFINGGLAVYYEPILDKLLDIKRKSLVEKVERKNYYLVIDEINRGNISKIFGELITLIEEEKRDTLEVTLPYSKNTFKVPSNLYIIGTMNSTDKSIALIDIALRRRFTFLKMEPKPDLVNHEKAQNIMIQLNDKITNTLGADYVLGHSYFMKVENDDDLEFVLEYKIKPLLEEYYYGDDNGLNDLLKICNVNNMIVDDNE